MIATAANTDRPRPQGLSCRYRGILLPASSSRTALAASRGSVEIAGDSDLQISEWKAVDRVQGSISEGERERERSGPGGTCEFLRASSEAEKPEF
ncbi:hypothetical protein Efla_002685 [Eimeria flavescens]